MIKAHRDRQNHSTGSGRRGTVFELNCCRLTVTRSWWLSCFIIMKGIGLVHISTKAWWEEVIATYGAGVSLVYNYFTSY